MKKFYISSFFLGKLKLREATLQKTDLRRDFMVKQNDVKNDIVFTSKYFADFMCDLAEIDETSVVLDNACGAGALLSSAVEKGAS